MSTAPAGRPVALVTGAGRRRGIATAVALRLAETGWDIAFTHLDAYDARMTWGIDAGAAEELADRLRAAGARAWPVEADFADVAAPGQVFSQVCGELGPAGALVLGHCESVATGIMDTSLESFDRHFAVNARAGWLLIREYARQFSGPDGSGRIIALTSDHTAGKPRGTANLVAFLCSPEGGWVNGQLIHSNGGLGIYPSKTLRFRSSPGTHFAAIGVRDLGRRTGSGSPSTRMDWFAW